MSFFLSENMLFLVILILATTLGAWCYRTVSRWWRRLLTQRRFKKGHKGEERARAYLVRNGYKILGEEVTIQPYMWIDGKKVQYTVRADYLTEKKGIRSIFEVKTGTAAHFKERTTRRQIREYAAVYDVDEVCLYDGNTDRHHTICFDTPPVPVTRSSRFSIWLFGCICGALVGAFVCAWFMQAL